jgi:hypothetical protein
MDQDREWTAEHHRLGRSPGASPADCRRRPGTASRYGSDRNLRQIRAMRTRVHPDFRVDPGGKEAGT